MRKKWSFLEELLKPGKGRALKVILIIVIIFYLWDFIATVVYLSGGKAPYNFPMPAWEIDIIPRGFFILTIIIDIVFIVFCILILLKKKWGVYALGSLLVVQVITPLFIYEGIPVLSVLASLIVSGLTIVFIFSLWAGYA